MAYMKQDVCAPAQTNAGTPQKSFTLKTDAEATKRHLSILVNMYTRPELAVVRETMQNAFDASPDGQVVATLPDEFTYEFSVKDTGRGMTEEELDTNIGVAGMSDKSGDATKAGEFGIGSLCPLTYTDAFSITSWKNGRKATLTAFKQDDGSLGYNVSKSTESKNPPGTLVTVPVHRNPSDLAKFKEALDSFRFSPKLAKRIKLAHGTFGAYACENRRDVAVGSHVVSFWSVAERSELFGQVVILVNDIPVAANLDRFPALKDFSESVFEAGDSGRTLVISFPAEAGIAVPPNRETVAVTRINTALISNACAKYLDQLTKDLETGVPTTDCAPAAKAMWQKLALQLGRKPQDCKKEADKALGAILEPHGLFAVLSVGNSYGVYRSRLGELSVGICHLFAKERPALLSWESRYVKGRYQDFPTVRLLAHPTSHSDDARWKSKGITESPAGVLPCSTKLTKIVVWPAAKDEWSAAINRKLVAAWLYEMGGKSETILLVGEPLDPSTILAKSGIEVVDFEQWKTDHKMSDDNPFAAQTEKGTVERSAKPRRQFSAAGWSNQAELPKAGFPYVSCMRGYMATGQFEKAFLINVWNFSDGCDSLPGWLDWFETSGISEAPMTVTCLTDGEIANLKRKHIKMDTLLSERMKLFMADLDEDEKDWFPRAWFAAALEQTAPELLKFLRSLDSSGYVKADPDFEPILAASRPPPSSRMVRVLEACKSHIAKESDLSWRFRGFTECQDLAPLDSGAYKDAKFYGISCAVLAQAAYALKRLSLRSDPMAVWFRIVWFAHALKGKATLIGQVNWFLPLPDTDLNGKEATIMAVPDALAKA